MTERKILIVDDVRVNRRIIREALLRKMAGVQIVEAENGIEALQVLAKQEIGVVILDIMMPEKDGLQVLTEMKTAQRIQNIPVLICSALDDTASIEAALSLGAVDYFTRPLTAEQIQITLPLKVKNALEFYGHKQQLQEYCDHVKTELQLAEALQRAMINNHTNTPLVEAWGRYIPCDAIGGDLFLCEEMGSQTWLLIADVFGHGITAAMIGAMINVRFCDLIPTGGAPGVILEQMNRMLMELFKDIPYALVSAFVACVADEGIAYANAGQPYPFIDQTHCGQMRELQADGLLLGVTPEARYETHYLDFGPDDRMVLYTDGVFDQGQPGGFAKWNVIYEYYRTHRPEFLENTSAALERMIRYFARQRQSGFADDAAVLVVRRKKD